MIHAIETVKQEIRILGVDTCRSGQAFGVVTRGGKYLDGVIRFSLERNSSTSLGKALLGTKYYPELRAIMMHDPKSHVVASILEKSTKLPVIAVLGKRRPKGRYSMFRSEYGTIGYRSRLPRATVERILGLTWTYGPLPEPARVAHLLAERTVEIAREGI